MTLCSADAAVLKRLEDPLIGQTLAGKYRIEQLIKTGGMGSVYRGKHVLMDKTVAIKVLRPALAGDDAVVARFSREAKAASKISHPHAVNVTDFGEAENGVVFLVMDYLDGRTLKEVISADGPLPIDRAVEIVRQVAGALDAAHAQGVIHRDLKSENIMLVRHNGDEWAKVLDFGIAKIRVPEGGHDAEITQANLVVGTPQYMSPEQCSQSGALDARSDVYSLGIIVYEMLTGRVPFTGESATAIMMKQVQDSPPLISSVRSDLPAGVAAVIKRALAKQPIDRFQSAGELSAALAEAATGDVAIEPEVAAATTAARTAPNTPIDNAADDSDEVTLVRPRERIIEAPPPRAAQVRPLPAASSFNPWRVMVPAAIALVVVFAAVLLLTRGSGSTDQTQGSQPALTADPNGQPVQPAGTPTGVGERDVRPVVVASPTPAPTRATENSIKSEVPANVNGEFGNENSNSGRGSRNTNQSAEPTPAQTDAPPPPPKPSPTIRIIRKPTPAGTPGENPGP